MFKQDDRFDVRATATDGELFLKLVERISFDVGIIWIIYFLSLALFVAEIVSAEEGLHPNLFFGNSGQMIEDTNESISTAAQDTRDIIPAGQGRIGRGWGWSRAVFGSVRSRMLKVNYTTFSYAL